MLKEVESFVERIVRGTERRVEEWREEDRQRRLEVEENGRLLRKEAAGRERSLAQAVREARDVSPEDAAKEKRVVFVLHSEEAGEGIGLKALIRGHGPGAGSVLRRRARLGWGLEEGLWFLILMDTEEEALRA